MARPSTYDPKKHDALAASTSIHGATWAAIASACERSIPTVKEWAGAIKDKPGHPSFVQAVEIARATANEETKSSLFKNANGQTTTTKTKTITVERVLPPKNAAQLKRIVDQGLVDKDGLIIVQKSTETTVETQHKGETGAQVFWLCNRQPEEWQHVQKIEGTGAGGAIPVRIVDDVPADA